MSNISENPFVVRWNSLEGGLAEGPIQVLWDLIDSYKVDIFDVSLSRITRDFIQFIKTSEKLSIELTSEFALMASHLVYWKSKALLPDPGFEEDDIEPPLPQELVEKLLEHKKFQMAGQRLGDLDRIASGVFTRESNQVLEEEEAWLDVSLVDLISAFNSLLESISEEKTEIPVYEGYEHYSIEDKMAYILQILEDQNEIKFEELFTKGNPSKKEIVAVFLAMLETVKIRKTRILQNSLFGEIKIVRAA